MRNKKQMCRAWTSALFVSLHGILSRGARKLFLDLDSSVLEKNPVQSIFSFAWEMVLVRALEVPCEQAMQVSTNDINGQLQAHYYSRLFRFATPRGFMFSVREMTSTKMLLFLSWCRGGRCSGSGFIP